MADETPAEFLKRTTSRGGPASGAPQPGQETPEQFIARTAPKTAETPAPDVPSVDDYAGQDSVNRIIETGVQAYRNTPSFWTSPTTGQSTRAQVENMDPYGFGRFIVAPAGDLVAGAFGVGAGLFRGGQEVLRSAIAPINPLLARDVAALPEVFPTGFGNMRPKPRANPLEPPQFIDERMPLSPEFMANPLTPEARTAASRAITDPNALTTPTGIRLAPPPSDAVTGQGGPRVTTPGGAAIPKGLELTPEQAAEWDRIPSGLPPMRGEIKTQADAAARADQIIQHFASVGNKEPIPGAEGALPTITGNAGLATLYRAVRDNPETNVHFTNLEDASKAKHTETLARLVQDKGALDAGEAAVEARTAPMREQAFANKTEANPAPVIALIDQIIASPSGMSDAVVGHLRRYRDKLVDKDGNILDRAKDPEQLYGLDKAIRKDISPLAAGTTSDARLAAYELGNVQRALRPVINDAAPGFNDYMRVYSEMQRPLDEMRYLQSRNLTSTMDTTTLPKIDALLKDIEKQRNAPGVKLPDSLAPETISELQAMREQMRRENLTATHGKSLGSNTFQNLATNTKMGNIAGHAGNALLTTGTGMAADLAFGGHGVAGGMAGAAASGVLKGVEKSQAAKAAARQETGRQMLMMELRDRLLNRDNKGVQSLQRSP